jgi:hypothetical protein
LHSSIETASRRVLVRIAAGGTTESNKNRNVLQYSLPNGRIGGDEMKRTLASLAVAASMLALISSEASAHFCRAIGLGIVTSAQGSSIVRAKLLALRRCEARAGLHVCTILYCGL